METGFCYSCMGALSKKTNTCPLCKAPVPYKKLNPCDLTPGVKLNERYIIGRCLGRGGFGGTYIAFDTDENQVCAIKEFFPYQVAERDSESENMVVIDRHQEEFDHYRRGFVEEAKVLKKLQSIDNIVNVYDIFDEYGTTYFTMEYLKGANVKVYLKDYSKGLPLREALDIVYQLLKALEKIHSCGLLHRDISLDNIMRLEDGTIKLIDFGSARGTYKSEKTTFGKGVYTAPEQNRGDKQRECTDLYAVGIVLFALLVGRLPGRDKLVPEALRSAKKNLPEEVYALYENSAVPNPNCRYQKASEMIEAVSEAINAAGNGKIRTGSRRSEEQEDGYAPTAGKKIPLIFLLLLVLLLFFLVLAVILMLP